MSKPDVVIVTEQRLLAPDLDDAIVCQLQYEEALLLRGLRKRGLSVERWAWEDPEQDWSQPRVALIRSPWNYFDDYSAFSAWLVRVSAQTRLLNSASLLQWNIDKHYLADLQRAGVAIVPTVFVERGSGVELRTLMQTQNWPEAVFKPVVSGGARLTHRVGHDSLSALEAVFADAVQNESMMLQPFLTDVLQNGEISLMVIHGVFSHAVRKQPKAGDFRVQDDHGGVVLPHLASADEKVFAEQVIAACPEQPIYARVDVVRDEQGELRLMELEIFEPELFFRFDTRSAERLADAVARNVVVVS